MSGLGFLFSNTTTQAPSGAPTSLFGNSGLGNSGSPPEAWARAERDRAAFSARCCQASFTPAEGRKNPRRRRGPPAG